MTQLRTIAASLILTVVGLATIAPNTASGEYVWARSSWGNGGGPNRPISVMGNGYGGYYVPRNAYGNNYEGQRITNPNGFIIPSQAQYQPQQPFRFRRR